uniref:Uncharacterized protein n=1 Tax=Polytomella parva TaxID=51329 RepID=A0A7S0UNC4_9CHLO|mmetsp:Transcript_15228/g.27056  ORF Transcript_15228/g.27056 Transcript_15228/m.27056 type:complete len:185 (+) Transcript_15228:61-615(+)|eukprot:CAMPEP_0175056610 /NCGR_PEP_ID=MMETSP0052_2-20121109/10775_1 /TAXON_ID=51329 ORGANISM="Polytomella parva, Strain SAG 63-3" /NCGR_SAMPLE_ID=MMETSP0052_2 /ASSEMBLY_ACC=CAM_ASM_000194 /LENGTH=184 /DNA_ID=CAMNT_0016321673 /DNA_START=49 /DNA_END=603 /DNA_ORIENTATION=+
MVDDKSIKASKKEGGKKGVDICGMSDLGGVKYFNVSLETCDGSLELLDAALEGFNAEVDEAAEERKGGASNLGKLLLSAGDKTVAILCNIPKSLQESNPEVTMADWVNRLVAACEGAEVAERVETETVIKLLINGNTEKGLFPLKMRDAAQDAGFKFVKEKGLIPADDDSDDYVVDTEAAGIEW